MDSVRARVTARVVGTLQQQIGEVRQQMKLQGMTPELLDLYSTLGGLRADAQRRLLEPALRRAQQLREQAQQLQAEAAARRVRATPAVA